jgi:hypothetical protein
MHHVTLRAMHNSEENTKRFEMQRFITPHCGKRIIISRLFCYEKFINNKLRVSGQASHATHRSFIDNNAHV